MPGNFISLKPDHPTPLLTDFRNEETFEALFRTHYSGLASFAIRYVEDRETAEEIVQEMFSSLWSKASEIRIKTSVKSYLYGAVRNACLNHLKHQKVRQSYAEEQKWTSYQDTTNFLELDELQSRIADALDKLPARCREIFELNRFDGKRYKEIAEYLQLSLKTVENQMGKALSILREELKDYLPLLWLLLAWG